ncbi:uncharacterized protein N7458_005028 [Penicillium daleae]|uniref:Uncharacterized protein n=1 Tax=Penicillium daleae TaxID=63821 RepID=A0AAD6C9Y4_9EURO|nr:uncharacterized protein N7458_005028 [Penicillium daleae]KAJ5454072.1 hypothetical protein N7458_005028 [Penicillium daleae]
MQIVYAVSAAFDIATTSTILVDDRLDQCDERAGCPTWHTRHAVTFPTDTGVLFAIGKRALRFLVPDSHPFKWKILSLYDDYQDYCLSYLSVAGARLQRASSEDIRQKLFYSVDSVTPETYRAFSWMRSGYYNTVMREACRLLACYSSVIATKSHRQLYFDVIARGNGVMCVLDDIRDSRALNIELPNRSIRGPLDEYLQYVKPEMMLDFLPGETHQTFLLASLELARGESKAMTLGEDEKSEIFAILVDCYWPKEQGLEEDPKVKESRIRRLCAMFLKYNLLKYLKEHVMSRALNEYFVANHQAVDVLKMPSDMLSYPIGAMLCEETDTRPDHVAAAAREIMATPNSKMNEEAKFQRMLCLFQDI